MVKSCVVSAEAEESRVRGAGSRRSLGGMREIPEGQALDVERVRPAILQMNWICDSSLTVDL